MSAAPLRQVTVVGGSVAGLGVAQALRRRGFDGAVTVLDADPHPAVQRPTLSKRFLTHELAPEDIRLNADLEGIDVRMGVRATGLDLAGRRLRIRDQRSGTEESLTVDGLVLATGATARTLPVPTPPGVHVLRTLADAEGLRADLRSRPRVVIIGAGFVGSEVASSCRTLGLDVTLVEAAPVPMSRVLGEAVGSMLEGLHRDHGTALRLGVGVAGFVGTDRVTGVQLADGEILPADTVLVGVGARPDVDWLRDSGITIGDGIPCGPDLAVADRVVAVGDIARWQHHHGGNRRIEHWENAARQAEIAAATLLEPGRTQPYTDTTMFWSDQYDCKLHLIGHPQPGDNFDVVEGSLDDRRFVGLYTRDGRLNAALLCNQPHRLRTYRTIVKDGIVPTSTPAPAQPARR